MANRVLRDWTDSEKVDQLTPGAEVFFTRLFMKADDFGSYYSNPKLLKAALFPLKVNSIEDGQVASWVNECIIAGLILLYEVNGKFYLRIINFGQRLRTMRGKFPQPLTIDSKSPPETKQETETEEETETEVVFPENLNSPDFKKKFDEWLAYRKEIKKPYKSNKSINQVLKSLSEFNIEFAWLLINRSMTNQWQGLIFEKTHQEFKNFKHDTNKTNRRTDTGHKTFGSL
jgi:hypothetical protein